MKYEHLTTEHMIGILAQRKLELEADYYRQEIENVLARKLEKSVLVEQTQRAMNDFEQAIGLLEEELAGLRGVPVLT